MQPTEDFSQILLRLSQELQAMATRQTESEQQIYNTFTMIQQQFASLAPTKTHTSPKAQVATPPDYDGDRTWGRAFVNSCNIYIRLCNNHFVDDQAKILWALSYMKHGRAAKWADAIFRWEECNPDANRFVDWPDFTNEFRTHFYPVDTEAAAVNVLEGAGYYQRSRNVDDYLDEFRNLITDSGYTDLKVIVVKFRRGLNPSIQNAVATMVSG
jgi:hypothetical protein